jgi:xanthine dehydrogenase accessory factor
VERPTDIFERIVTLKRDGQPFVLATVVARRAPVSAHLGDRAIILADGRMEGFVGGACAREIVRHHALEAIRLRQGRLVSIRPDAADTSPSTDEYIVVPMTCASEGAVDVYVEPFLQAPALLVVGATPVAEALARQARAMDYAVTRVVDAREEADVSAASGPIGVTVITLDGLDAALRVGPPDPAVIVASQGHYDEVALEVILTAGVSYVGLLASRQRGASVRAYLEDRKTPRIDTIRSPVGLDLGARTPQEVALSILADIVSTRTRPQSSESVAPRDAVPAMAPVSSGTRASAIASPAFAVDPVCGMRVEVATARHTAEVDGVTYYFCSPHCRARFVQQPQDYPRFTT